MDKHLRRIVVAVATVMTCLVALANPAGAVTVNLTGTDITVGSDIFTIPGSVSCPAPVIELGGLVEIIDLDITLDTTVHGEDLVLVLSLYDYPNYSVPGTVTFRTSPLWDGYSGLQTAVQFDFYTTSGGCVPDTHVCAAATILDLTGDIEEILPTTGDGFTGAGVDITGGLQAVGACPSPLGSLIGLPVTANLVGVF